MKTIAYLRISTDKQDLDKQRLMILDYAHKQGIEIDHFNFYHTFYANNLLPRNRSDTLWILRIQVR